MKFLIANCLLYLSSVAYSQTIVNLVLVGDKGITENIKEANSFIVIKKYPNGFQRLDYKIAAPIKKVRSYSDSTLTILEGNYYEYTESGMIAKSGFYSNNKKDKDWFYYNNTNKVILIEKYKGDVLISTVNPDTVIEEKKSEQDIKGEEREAIYENGDADWGRYLSKNVNTDVGAKSSNGGQVKVSFKVDTVGKCVDIYLAKSVEFVLDEELIRLIENSPLWQPAIKEGKLVNAYRSQPLTFPANKED